MKTFFQFQIIFSQTHKILFKRKENLNNNFLTKNSCDKSLSCLFFGDFQKIQSVFTQMWIYLAKDKNKEYITISIYNYQCPVFLLYMLQATRNINVKSFQLQIHLLFFTDADEYNLQNIMYRAHQSLILIGHSRKVSSLKNLF